MYQRIYKDLNFSQPAVYQIKFKGTLSSPLTPLVKQFRATIETSDLNHPVTMLTGKLNNQTELIELINSLHRQGHSIISMACIDVLSSIDSENEASV